MEYKAGDRLCSCTLLQKCGEGSYGEVWLAEDTIGTKVALKILHNKGRYSERELAGLKNYKDCNHPNLLKIRYVEITDQEIFYTMDAADDLNRGQGEYCPDTLAKRLNRFGRLDGKEITAMLEGLLAGLEELHKQGLVHRDIKPDNILWVNGRATLADVGLIAFEGAGSLVGSPGFLSPHVMEGNPAQASDDFYALGKVIYCALTGLAVNEYPSLPPEMTISVDAALNKALRVSCSRKIHSTAEFRELLKGKSIPLVPKKKEHHSFPLTKLLTALIVIILASGFIYLFVQQEKIEAKHIPQPVERWEIAPRSVSMNEAKHIPQPVERDMEGEKRLAKLQNASKDAARDLQEAVKIIFQRSGWLKNGKMLPFLLDYETMKREEMQELLFSSTDNPRLKPIHGVYRKKNRGVLPIEAKLWGMLHGVHYPDFDKGKVQARQHYWRSRKGDPAEILKEMLTTDPVMQALGLDGIIRHGINKILEHGAFRQNEESELKRLIAWRHALLDPQWRNLQYVSGKLQRNEW